MTPIIDATARLLDGDDPNVNNANPPEASNLILITEEDLRKGKSYLEDDASDSNRGYCETSSAKFSSKIATKADVTVAQNAIPKKPLYYRAIKRGFDIVFSSCVIAVGLVPSLVLSAFVVKDTGGSPIYSSTRIGQNGKKFRILKFRSMVVDADDLEKHLTPEQLVQWHREHKLDDDPRITKLGSFLRSSSIDEFPQFINVFFGQMSTIGSRAVTEEEAEYYGEAKSIVLSMRPGITGLWQTGPRNLATWESGLRQKFK